MKKLFSILAVTFTLTACLSDTVSWDGSYNQLPEVGKSCAVSWVDNFYSIEQAEEAIKSLGFKPDKIIVLKSGSSGMAAYNFTALVESKGKYMSIVSSSKYEKAIVAVLNGNIFNQLSIYMKSIETDGNKIYKGDIANVSHVPCDFIYYKSQGKAFKQAYIGLFKSGGNFAKAIKKLPIGSYQQKELMSTPLPVPSEHRLEKLRKRIEENLFFELDDIEDL
ncbi:hypothetical protein AAEH84_19720 [Shewanella indica]|uniref:hypothetical protein n=1 Tax=Shewanella TaxID=22 RepID=UPI00313DC662